MAKGRYSPPQNSEELRRRYAEGERMFRRAELGGSGLSGADLSGADLSGADLRGMNLSGTNFSDVIFRRANLSGSILSVTKFRDADLSGADLSGAYLGGADLSGAYLSRANLSGAYLSGANLGGATVGFGTLANLDLSPLCDADPPIKHGGPSTVDHRAIAMSLRSPYLKDFLQRTGMPEVFVEYSVSCALSLDTDVFGNLLQSTFLSFGGPDEPFARKLYEALHRNGVTTFFFPAHAMGGEKIEQMMREGISGHDRVILVCSQASLDRPGLLFELEETLMREWRDRRSYLLPLRLDDHVLGKWAPARVDLAQAVRDRVVANFEGADQDEDKFNAGLLRLIAALRK
jgi:hypothetical protein